MEMWASGHPQKRRIGFNEAMTFRSWKLSVWALSRASPRSFNEAMTFRSWKSRDALGQRIHRGPGFNEAMTFRSWK